MDNDLEKYGSVILVFTKFTLRRTEMAVLKGYQGNFKVGTDTVGEISEWTLDVSADIIDKSAFGDEWKKKVATQKDWTGSITGRLDTSDTGQSALTIGAEITANFYTDATHYYWSCDSRNISCSAAVVI